MASHTFARLEDLFHRALPLDAEDRRLLLDRECDHADLRRQVEDLLAAESTRTEPFEQAVRQGMGWIAEGQTPPRIGPYRVLREVGHGGFSTVYLAQRDDGHFDMQVAIKLVHRHLRSPEVLRRLRRERQILAHLDHPNIARIFDGGSTEDGTPYVVMEYIVGQPIDQYCETHGLSLQERVQLFRQVCDAVQYAHRSLVLHRDLKPSNILVNETGAVKLVDFGIAKVLHEEGESLESSDSIAERDLHTLLTLPGSQALTPEFASPEQFLGRPLTTATDVYSLGVVLYVLISGRRPYVFEQRRWADIERVLCEVQPLPPGQQDAATRHRSTELDVITLKALHKEPERRYASAEALSEDLRRHLRGLPIRARQDSLLYRSTKFVRRHAAWVGTLTALFLTLLAAVVVTRWQALEAQLARQRAEQEQVRAERQTEQAAQVARFLEELFADADPYANKGRDLTAYEVVQRGAQRIRREVQHDPPLSAALMGTMGRVYRRLAHYDDAEELLRVAIATHRSSPGGSPLEQAQALRDLAILFLDRGQCQDAEQFFQEAAALEQDLESSQLAATLHYQGRNAMQCGDLQRAESLVQRALVLQRQTLGDGAEALVDSESLLAELLFHRGEVAAAGRLFEQVLAKRRAGLGNDHPKVAISLSDTAATLQTRGDPAAAIPLYTEALDLQRETYGELHGSVAQTLYNLGTAHSQMRRWSEAQDFLQASLHTHREVYGDQHPGIADCLYELASVYRGLGKTDLAEDALRQDLDLRHILGGDLVLLARSKLSLGSLIAQQEPDEALTLYREALDIQEHQEDAPLRLAYTLTFLGRLLVRQDQPHEAHAHLLRALEIHQTLAEEPPIDLGLAEYNLARCLAQLGRTEEARARARASVERLETALGTDDPRTRRAQRLLDKIS